MKNIELVLCWYYVKINLFIFYRISKRKDITQNKHIAVLSEEKFLPEFMW